jgi:hypothetical protein
MERDPSVPLPDEQLTQFQLANALGDIRDSWVMISSALKDVMTDMPSAGRDEVLTEVERHLCRIRESGRRSFDRV